MNFEALSLAWVMQHPTQLQTKLIKVGWKVGWKGRLEGRSEGMRGGGRGGGGRGGGGGGNVCTCMYGVYLKNMGGLPIGSKGGFAS